MTEALSALAVGALFGGLLNKAGLTHYARIVGVYRLQDATVLRFMLSALLVGAVAVELAISLGLGSPPAPATNVLANALGGVVFGVGMASAGYCPGTIVAEAAEGRLDACFAGLGGLILGALGFGLLQPSLMPVLNRVGAFGHVTLSHLGGVNPWLGVALFVEVGLLALLLLARADAKGAHATKGNDGDAAATPDASRSTPP